MIRALGAIPKKELEDLEIRGQEDTIQKKTGDLRRIAVTQTPLKDHQRRCEKLSRSNYDENDKMTEERQVLTHCQVIKKPIKHEYDGDTSCKWWSWLWNGFWKLEIDGIITIIQTIAWLRLARILRRLLKTREDLLSLRLQLKTIT